MPDTDALVEPVPEATSEPDQAPDSGSVGDWHIFLLRMAGAAPDDLISEARAWVAEGLLADVAQAMAFAAATSRIPILPADSVLMASTLTAAGEDTDVLSDLVVATESELLPNPWSFSPVRIEDEAGAAVAPPLLDLTTDEAGLAGLDPVDRAALTAVGDEPGVSALYRSWRAPADGSQWPAARRVFVVATGEDLPLEQLPALTARIQEALIEAGENAPQVEVARDGMTVPTYHSMAWAHSALLWATEPTVPLQLARVFDVVDPDLGPSFAPDHPVLEDPDEIVRLLDYLENGLPILTTTALMADVLDPDQVAAVPLTFRTDGAWIWTDTISYYLSRYALAPEPELLEHLRSVDELPPLTEVGLHRVLAFLQRPDDVEPVWVVPETGEAESSRAPV